MSNNFNSNFYGLPLVLTSEAVPCYLVTAIEAASGNLDNPLKAVVCVTHPSGSTDRIYENEISFERLLALWKNTLAESVKLTAL